MTLRIRELIIHAEIGGSSVQEKPGMSRSDSERESSRSETRSMTRRFYEEDLRKNNER